MTKGAITGHGRAPSGTATADQLTHRSTLAIATSATGSPETGMKMGTGFETPAAPATVSGEPSNHMPLGSS
jgi:hypothetical protein